MEKEKIYLNILGLKNFINNDLQILLKEVESLKLKNGYSSILYEPVKKLAFKIRYELNKRERSEFVWVEFVSYWSGYTSSRRKIVGKHYRKIERLLVDKMPKYYSYKFSDNTANDWSIKIVDIRGKDEGGYTQQIDEFLAALKNK